MCSTLYFYNFVFCYHDIPFQLILTKANDKYVTICGHISAYICSRLCVCWPSKYKLLSWPAVRYVSFRILNCSSTILVINYSWQIVVRKEPNAETNNIGFIMRVDCSILIQFQYLQIFQIYCILCSWDITWRRTDVSWRPLHFCVLKNSIKQVRYSGKGADLNFGSIRFESW
jgi:hypothetical protein